MTHEGLLYVVGGCTGLTDVDSVEVYDPATNSWSRLPTSMGIGQSYAGRIDAGITVINRPTFSFWPPATGHGSEDEGAHDEEK